MTGSLTEKENIFTYVILAVEIVNMEVAQNLVRQFVDLVIKHGQRCKKKNDTQTRGYNGHFCLFECILVKCNGTPDL